MPQEAADNTAQMRKVIVDQIEALAELNRIVAHHGRGLDVVSTGRASVQRQEEPVMVAAARPPDDDAPRMRDSAAARRICRRRTSACRRPRAASKRRRTSAPFRAAPKRRRSRPAGPDQGRGDDGCPTCSTAPTAAPRPRGPARPAPQPAAGGNPLESLSLDIGRLMDRNLAAEMWDRYQRGESKAFTKRLYTPAGQKAFDEVARKYRADRAFKQTVDRYITEFERLLDDVARDERGPRRCAATSPRRPGWSTLCLRTRQDGSGKDQAKAQLEAIGNGGIAASVF